MISERTKAALKAAKARGTRLGNPQLAKAAKRGTAAVKANARQFAANVLPIIEEIERAGITSHNAIAAKLNERNVRTARGGKWHSFTVHNVLSRAQRFQPEVQASRENLNLDLAWTRRTAPDLAEPQTVDASRRADLEPEGAGICGADCGLRICVTGRILDRVRSQSVDITFGAAQADLGFGAVAQQLFSDLERDLAAEFSIDVEQRAAHVRMLRQRCSRKADDARL